MGNKKAKLIDYPLHLGGSQHGFSHYSRWAGGCPKAAALSAEHPKHSLADYSGAVVGTIGHVLMELHHRRALEEIDDETLPTAIRYSDVVDERARAEAERVFRAYRMVHPDPEHLGKVCYVEVDLPRSTNPDHPALMAQAVGIDPYTCRIDLVVELTAKDVKRLKACTTHEIDGAPLKKGYWLVDHKFYARRMANLIDQSMASLQFASYCLAWNATHPKLQVEGVLQNTLFKLKEPVFRLTVVPKPNEEGVKILHNYYHHVVNMMASFYDTPVPTQNNCFPYGGICKWYQEGLCKRY